MSARLAPPPPLRAVRMYLHALHQPVRSCVFDCHVCRSEGLPPGKATVVGEREVQALLYQIDSDLLATGQVVRPRPPGRSGYRRRRQGRSRHPPVLESLAGIRRRVHGQRLSAGEFAAIVRDGSAHRRAFVGFPDSYRHCHWTLQGRQSTSPGDGRGRWKHRQWNAPIVVDKHCVGGLPGNRTTPIVVAIAAANGLAAPKHFSRAPSPRRAGTADTMETLAPVGLTSLR